MELLLFSLLGYIVGPIVVLALLYWVIRTAVRDGILAARERTDAAPR